METMIEADQYQHYVDPHMADNAEDFLRQLNDCTVIDVKGKDTSRTRVISTLIHGNEPSGLIALHRWLQTKQQPVTNLRLIIASVSAALQPPMFSHRFLDGEEDLNRCFNGTENKLLDQRAEHIVALVRECNPELIIDLHNTSGRSSAFSVSLADGPLEKALNSFFCSRMILTRLRVGSLMEQDFGCPFVTIECGGANDETAHEVAYHGIEALAWCDDFTQGHHFWPIQVLAYPLRIELMPDTTLAYGTENQTDVDLCLVDDIESRNMDITPQGYCLGWVNTPNRVIRVRNEQGYEVASQPFKMEGNKLVARTDLQMFMATTNAHIALNDCLFYVICM